MARPVCISMSSAPHRSGRALAIKVNERTGKTSKDIRAMESASGDHSCRDHPGLGFVRVHCGPPMSSPKTERLGSWPANHRAGGDAGAVLCLRAWRPCPALLIMGGVIHYDVH